VGKYFHKGLKNVHDVGTREISFGKKPETWTAWGTKKKNRVTERRSEEKKHKNRVMARERRGVEELPRKAGGWVPPPWGRDVRNSSIMGSLWGGGGGRRREKTQQKTTDGEREMSIVSKKTETKYALARRLVWGEREDALNKRLTNQHMSPSRTERRTPRGFTTEDSVWTSRSLKRAWEHSISLGWSHSCHRGSGYINRKEGTSTSSFSRKIRVKKTVGGTRNYHPGHGCVSIKKVKEERGKTATMV